MIGGTMDYDDGVVILSGGVLPLGTLAAEDAAVRAEEAAELAAAFTAESPTSWEDFSRFLPYQDGKVVQFNGVLFERSAAAAVAGLPTGPGWRPFGDVYPQHYGAIGDGVTNDTAAISLFLDGGNGVFDGDTYLTGTSTTSNIDGANFSGEWGLSSLKNLSPENTANFINFYESKNIKFSDVDIENGKTLASQNGHALVIRNSDDTWVDGVRVTGMAGTGTGVIGYRNDGLVSKRLVVTNSEVYADRTQHTNINGIIYTDAHWSRISGNYTEGVGEFPQELKNDCRYSLVTDALINDCRTGLYNGNQGSAIHPSYNVHGNVVIKGSDFGIFTGEGEKNLYGNILYDVTGSVYASPEGVRHTGSDSHVDIMTAGSVAGTVGVRYQPIAVNNSTKIIPHHDTPAIVSLQVGATGNYTDVVHLGYRASLLSTSAIAGRTNIYSATAGLGNPVHCSAAGEWLGSLTNTFKWYLADNPSVARQTADIFNFVAPTGVSSRITLFGNTGFQSSFMARTPTYSAGLTFDDGSGSWRFSRNPTEAYLSVAPDAVRMSADSTASLGASAFRWTQVYAANGTINTSDEREKQDILPISDAVLDAWGDVSFVTFRWIESVRNKGDDARIHSGVIAQQVRDAFKARGLNALDYGLLCFDEWEAIEQEVDEEGVIVSPALEAGNRWGIRADQCLFVEAAYQRRRTDNLEARISALEAK